MSETKNLKLFKHDNPSTNTNQFDVEKSLNQNWDKIDTEIGNIRENINGNDTDITDLKSKVTDLETNLETAQNNIDEIKQEQITQNGDIEANTTAIEKNTESIEQNTTDITKLKEENAMLKLQIPKGQASGEEISLSDSAEMELVEFGLQGNSKQNTREGYNLANYNTSSSVSNFEIGDIENGKNYTLSFNIKGTSGYNLRTKVDGSMVTNIATKHAQTGNQLITFTATEDAILYINGFEGSSGFEFNQIMLLEGTYTSENLPAFEEYGKMPSLNYLSEVEAVGDNINLYPYENVEFVSEATQEQWCFIDGIGGAYGKNLVDYTDYKITLEKGKYYFKLDTDDSNIITGGLVKNGENSEIGLGNLDGTFEITETTVCTLRLKVANPSLGINIKSIKLEKGTAATAYSPYGQGSVEIVKSNKNLLNWLDILNKIGIELPYSKEINGINFNIDEKGKISVKGTSTSTIQWYLTGSWDSKTVRYVIGNVENTIASGTNFDWSKGLTCTFLDNSEDTKIHLDFYNSKNNKCAKSKFNITAIIFSLNTGVTINETYNLQLENGNEATEIIEHESNTYTIPIQKPFHKIGDYSDVFIKQNNFWYEQHYIKELVLTGEESIDRNTVFENSVMVNTAENELYNFYVPTDLDETYVMCNMLKATSRNDCYSDISVGGKTALGNTTGRLFITIANIETGVLSSDNDTTITNKIKTWLQELYNAGIPIKIYYVLATPELIECTAEQTAVLEQIIKDGTYKEVTHFYTTEDLKPTIELTYYKDLETLFKNQASIQETLNNVQAQLLELGGN